MRPDLDGRPTPTHDKATRTLVTGASAGIGRELVAQLCVLGHSVGGVARRRDRLDALAARHAGFTPWPCDLGDRLARARLAAGYLESQGPPDYLVLNAGLGHYGKLHRLTEEQIDEQLEVNLDAVIDLTRRFLPPMLEARRGRILVVASVLAVGAVPFSSIYTATKHGVVGFVKALRCELRGTGVGATAFCPAGVHTEFRSGATGGPQPRTVDEEPVERVVRGIVRRLDRDRAVVFPTWRAWLVANLFRAAPRTLEWLLSGPGRSRFGARLPQDRVA